MTEMKSNCSRDNYFSLESMLINQNFTSLVLYVCVRLFLEENIKIPNESKCKKTFELRQMCRLNIFLDMM